MRALRGVLLTIAVLVMPVAAQAETRIALVIGNANYANVQRLSTPVNDAQLVAAALRRVGFTVVVETDLNKSDFQAAFFEFADMAERADVVAFYYAGHAFEMDGRNYLLPVDAAIAKTADVEREAVPLDGLLRSVEGARGTKLIFLDACRNNPLVAAFGRGRGFSFSEGNATTAGENIFRGLAPAEAPSNVFVAYAAQPGSTAEEGSIDSPFAIALARDIMAPGVELNGTMRKIQSDVMAATGGRQMPAFYGPLANHFYFVPRGGTVAPPVAPPAPAKPVFAAMLEKGGIRLVATAGPDGVARIYRGDELIGSIRGHAAPIERVAFVAGGDALLTTDSSGMSQVTRIDSLAAHGWLDLDPAFEALRASLWTPYGEPATAALLATLKKWSSWGSVPSPKAGLVAPAANGVSYETLPDSNGNMITTKTTRDGRGNVIETDYSGADGKPALFAIVGYARAIFTYDNKNRRIAEEYFGTDGRPMMRHDLGAARLTTTYDQSGKVIRTQKFGPGGQLIP